MKERNDKKGIWILCFIGGLIAVLAGLVPLLILQERSVFPVRDQLDGVVVDYLLSAKHLFDPGTTLPEYLSGNAPRQSFQRSPMTVLFYCFFDVFHAFLFNHIFVILTAYLGMFFLCRRLNVHPLAAAVAAVLFSNLPLSALYGLCCYGIPLAFLAYVEIRDKGMKAWWAFVLLFVFLGFSSLVLVGYAVLIIFCIGIAETWIGKKAVHRKALMATVGITGVVYGVINHSLIEDTLFGRIVSHRTEFGSDQGGREVLESLKSVLIFGTESEVPSLHLFILILSLLALTIGVILRKQAGPEQKRKLWKLLRCMTVAVGIAFFFAFMNCHTVVTWKEHAGGVFSSFKFERFYYISPCVWYGSLGLSLDILFGTLKPEGGKKNAVRGVLIVLVTSAILVAGSWNVFWHSTFKTNLREVIKKEGSTNLPWKDYYCQNIFNEIDGYIKENYGLSQDEYRVGNLGIEPAVSLLSGFYTIDGYSTNYPLSYKHEFRKIIEKELEKNDYNRMYFDDWGNRCYLFSSEYYGNPYLSKYEHAHFDDLELNTTVLKEMDCRFLFAAGEIARADEKGYRLVNIFDSYDYSYVIYLYEII